MGGALISMVQLQWGKTGRAHPLCLQAPGPSATAAAMLQVALACHCAPGPPLALPLQHCCDPLARLPPQAFHLALAAKLWRELPPLTRAYLCAYSALLAALAAWQHSGRGSAAYAASHDLLGWR